MAQIQISILDEDIRYKGLVFCSNNGRIMENTDKGLIVPKWVLIVRPKIPQMHQNLSGQAQKFGISMKKGFHRASPVHELTRFMWFLRFLFPGFLQAFVLQIHLALASMYL